MTLERIAFRELDRHWPTDRGQPLVDRDLAGARFSVHRHEPLGFLLHHDFFGRFIVAGDGSSIRCAPRDLPDWQWQRFLVGQLLPLAAVLHGLEPIHASAVGLGGRAILCLGVSGAGKSSIALHLAGRGAALLADDVTATEVRGGTVLAHRGAALASVCEAELLRLAAVGSVADWSRLGTLESKVRLLAPRPSGPPPPVGALYLITRHGGAGAIEIEPIRSGRGPLLLGSTFNAYHASRRRLASQLALCGRIDATVPLHTVKVPGGACAAESARAIEEHARSQMGRSKRRPDHYN